MRIGMDEIGANIFVGEEDNPRLGTIHIEITEADEFLIRLTGDDVDINTYVSIELWKTLYNKAFKEANECVRYSKWEIPK